MSSYFLQLLIWWILVTKSRSDKETFEVESAVIRCQNPQAVDDDDFRVVNWKPRPLTSFNVPVKPGPHDPNSALDMELENDIDLSITRMTKCISQAIITLKVKHSGNIPLDDVGTLIKLDHVLDERSGKSVRLGNPLGIKIQEGPLFAVYPMKYRKTVNAKPTEVMTNYPNSKNLWKCDGDICGSEGDNLEGGDTSHATTGFCCSCDVDNFEGELRGGHQCRPNGTEHFYSTHCFHLSDYWYAVFEIGAPEIFHQVYIQIYESEEKDDGTVEWKISSGKGETAKIDPLSSTTFLVGEKLSITYRKVESHQQSKSIDQLASGKNVLLIPTLFYGSTPISTKDDKSHELYQKHPPEDDVNDTKNLPVHFKNGIDDGVLVVPKTLLGGKCNEVGVTPESFTRQPSSCREASGTCLRNQPFELWESDTTESIIIHYRLKHFGKVHSPAPFKRIKDKMFFVMEHTGDAVGYIDIELPADQLQVMRPGYSAQLISVLSGCSSSSGAKLIVEVANGEHVPAFYGVNILSCTHGLPLQKSELRVIDALRMSTYQLDLHYTPGFQLHTRAKCSVGVLNQYNEVVAFRTVLLSPGDTCICSLSCKCACAEDSPQFSCIPLSDDEILSVGFPDPQEFMDYGDELSDFFSPDKLPYLILIAALVLIILGVCKGLIGLCGFRKVKNFGLWYFRNKPRKLDRYYEKEYARLDVFYDEAGNPVDPFTKLPTVERLSRCEQFGLNTFFFLLLPVFCIWNCCCWCFCSRKLSESSHSMLPTNKTPLDKDDKGDKDGTPHESRQKLPQEVNPQQSQTRSQFGSPAESYNQLYQDSVHALLSTPSHRSLFSSTNETPYGSWHQKPGQVAPTLPVNNGQERQADAQSNHSGLAPALLTKSPSVPLTPVKSPLAPSKSESTPIKSTTTQVASPTKASKSTPIAIAWPLL